MMRITVTAALAAAVVTVAAVSAGAGGARAGEGSLVTEQLDLAGFTEIEVPGSWEVEVQRGDFQVEVTVDEDFLDRLQVERRRGVLRFGIRQRGRWIGPVTLRARVSMPELEAVTISGSGSVRFDGFESRELRLQVSGSGRLQGGDCQADRLRTDVSGSGSIGLDDCALQEAEVTISGSGDTAIGHDTGGECRAREVSVRISGSGQADLQGCQFSNAEVSISGSGNATLLLGTGRLSGVVSGSGSIVYRGDPQRVDVRTPGSGRVIKDG